MDEYTLTRYEVVIKRRNSAHANDRFVYVVWADCDENAAFQAGATHVAEGKHAADMEVIGIRSENEV